MNPAKVAKQIEDAIAAGKADGIAMPRYSRPDNPFAGLSYSAVELVLHTNKSSELSVHYLDVGEAEIHCFLLDGTGKVIDPTVKKFPRKPDYSKARPGRLMSSEPSARTRRLADVAGIVI